MVLMVEADERSSCASGMGCAPAEEFDPVFYREHLAALVHLHREAQRLSQIELAQRAQVSRSFVQQLEYAHLGRLDLLRILQVLRALDLPAHLVFPPPDSLLTELLRLWPLLSTTIQQDVLTVLRLHVPPALLRALARPPAAP